MVSHSCHTNHDVVILVIRVTNVNFAMENFEENCPASKILVGFFFFNMANLLQIKL